VLYDAQEEQLDWTADELKDFGPPQILGAHRTGDDVSSSTPDKRPGQERIARESDHLGEARHSLPFGGRGSGPEGAACGAAATVLLLRNHIHS
jgi:hypothetical protein